MVPVFVFVVRRSRGDAFRDGFRVRGGPWVRVSDFVHGAFLGVGRAGAVKDWSRSRKMGFQSGKNTLTDRAFPLSVSHFDALRCDTRRRSPSAPTAGARRMTLSPIKESF
jgi:hypothetical protein